ncbi:MAG TPA: hypothetical protein VMN60_02800 [Longimicrobiales bacterium]|nr:hypothetical protein [Longimicrobiales bacterium]
MSARRHDPRALPAQRRASFALDAPLHDPHALPAQRRASFALDAPLHVPRALPAQRRASFALDARLHVPHALPAQRRASLALDAPLHVPHALRVRRSCRRAALVSLVLLSACARALPHLPDFTLAEPAASDIESVIFLFGDAGYADEHRHPIIRRLARDVEGWSGRLARDSAVVVLFLGDIVYKAGLHDAGTPEWPKDSAIAESQVNLLAGPNARRYGSIGYFLAGNHDWGNARNEQGVARLHNLELFIDRRRARGTHVRLQPEAGEPGPAVIDIKQHTRLLLFDTAWWVLAQDDYRKQRSFQQTEDAIRSTRGRNIIVAAHHPFKSGATHGGLVPFWKAFGLRWFLNRSGALQQDITSAVYREMREALLEAFRAGPPLIYAGGHDHNLQVIEHTEFPWPKYSAIAGSGSRVTPVGHVEGMLYRRNAPGYMRIVTYHDGRVDLFATAAPDDKHMSCPGAGVDLEQCMSLGAARYTTQFGKRLK